MPFTAAAAEAVRRAASGRQPYNPVDLLLALLNDAGCRAAEMLRVCGAESAGLRAAIEGRPGTIDDSVAPELQTMRDRAIGRTAYPSPGLRDPLTAFAVATHVNLIGQPMLWIRLEAQEQARAHGRVKSDDLLLAVAAAYEIARAYPYMSTPGDSRWGGAEALWRAGARYADLKRLHLYVDLGSEAPLSNRVVKGARDTGTLLRQLLDAGDRRAVRLLAAGGVARP